MKIVYYNIPYHNLLTKKWYIRFTIVVVHFAFPPPPWLVFTASDFLVPLWNTSLIFLISFWHIGHFLLVRFIFTPHGRHVVTCPHGRKTKPHGWSQHTEQNPMDSSPSHLLFSTFETTGLTFPSPSDDTFMVIIYSSLLTTREKLGGSSNIILPGDVILTRLSTWHKSCTIFLDLVLLRRWCGLLVISLYVVLFLHLDKPKHMGG